MPAEVNARLRLGPGSPRLGDQLDQLTGIDAESWTVALVPADSGHEDAEHRFEIEIKNARRSLRELGASEAQTDRVVAELTAAGHSAGPAVLVLLADDRVVAAGPLPEAPDETYVAHGVVPSLIPALDLERHQIAHVAVLVDREGADLWIVPRTGEMTAEQVQGDVDVIHQPKSGGWSQPRFQQRARNTWDENATDVAEHVAEVAGLIEAEVIVVAGDPKAMPLLIDHLPQRWRERVVTDDGASRSHEDGFDEHVATVIADHVARRMTKTLKDLRNTIAEDRAVEGPEAVDLLGEGRIGRVVISHDLRSGIVGHMSYESGTIMGSDERAEALGEETAQIRLADLALWGALRYGAEVEIVPGGAAAPKGCVAGFRRDV